MRDRDVTKQLIPEGFTSWPEYWQSQGMSWRTEPEIHVDRQHYLAERRATVPNIQEMIYPFRDENGSIRLTRADVEWLLATHESNGVFGPVDWCDVDQRSRMGLDLRGADLRHIDLRGLPLAKTYTVHTLTEGNTTTPDQRRAVNADFRFADLSGAHLEGARLGRTRFEGVLATAAHFEWADLYGVHLEGADFRKSYLQGADLAGSFWDQATRPDDCKLYSPEYGPVIVLNLHWNGAPLDGLAWSEIPMLGDEFLITRRGRELNQIRPWLKDRDNIFDALRANRQLASELRNQGLNEQADFFAYRAKHLNRRVSGVQGHYLSALGSWLLDLISGYGYKPMRSIISYIVVILSFAAGYFILTNFSITPFLPTHSSPLAWYEAVVLSISSFHGRGLFPSGLSLGDPVAILAAFEAIIGLLIEITFIATFTQRFFAR